MASTRRQRMDATSSPPSRGGPNKCEPILGPQSNTTKLIRSKYTQHIAA
jgi:hypothetical protein